MGKTKTSKRNRLDVEMPTGLQSVKQMEKEQEITAADLTGIETVIEKLSSACQEDREYGCSALGVYISNKATLNEVLKRNAVRLVAPLLQESKISMQLAASGLLRGMSEEGGFEACEQMIRQDVLTGLSAYLRDRVSSWQQSKQEVKTDGHLHSFINSIYLVQNLCECSALAVRLSIEDSVPHVLLSTLDASRFTAPVLLAAAQCLYTMSEENESMVDLLKQPDNESILSSLIANEKVLLYTRIIVAGVHFNTYGFDILNKQSGDVIINLLLSALKVDSYHSLSAVVTSCLRVEYGIKGGQQIDNIDSNGDVEMDQDEEAGKKSNNSTESIRRKDMESLDHLLSAQKLSFEIITNLLGGDDTDDWADMDADDDSASCGTADSSDLMDEEDMEALPDSSIATTLSDRGLIQYMGERLRFLDSELYQKVATSDKLHRQALHTSLQGYDSMLTSALLCLNNTLPQMKLEKFGGAEALQSMLKLLLTSLTVPQVSSQEMLVESITSAMRSLTQQLTAKSQSVTFDESELNTLQHLTMVSHTATAVNALKCVAAVGVSLSKQPTPDPIIKAIGTLLLQVVTTSKQLWLVTESLDSIMDVFAEDSNNIYMKELDVISTLQQILPQLKTMVSKRDRTNDHFLPVLSTVRSNLPRFIKYKNKVL